MRSFIASHESHNVVTLRVTHEPPFRGFGAAKVAREGAY